MRCTRCRDLLVEQGLSVSRVRAMFNVETIALSGPSVCVYNTNRPDGMPIKLYARLLYVMYFHGMLSI